MTSPRTGWLLAAVALWAAPALADDRPNVLFILSDDQRWDAVAALGNPEVRTPNLDALARRGLVFRNAYCMGSMMPAVCLPSRTMLLTGQSLWRCPPSMRAKTAPPGTPLLPAVLNEAGYVTFHCGKLSNSCTFANAAFATNIETKGRTADSAKEHADRTIEFLTKHDGKRPFFAYVAPPVPHDPRLASAESRKLYNAAKLSLPRSFLPRHPFDNGELEVRDEKLAAVPRQPDEMRRHLADYYATITDLDAQVGRMLHTLKERKWLEKTVIIFSSDQGLAVGGAHGLMGKQNLYEHVKPPLILAGPGVPKGSSDALVYLHDLMPTICDLCAAKVPAKVDGRSLLPIIEGKQKKVRDVLLGAYRSCQRMVRDDRFKLIAYNAAGVRNTQLFDLAADPHELKNLADDPRHADDRKRMEKLLASAWAEAGDPVNFDAKPIAGKRPNVVFILTDDQGYGDLSCHGNPVLKTPNLDRLHREGVRFTDFHVSPTCAPTRSALFTGRHEFRNGVTHTILERERLTPKAVTLADVLKSAGYTTGIFGKWHLGDEEAYRPDRRGFDEVFIHGAGGIGQTYAGSCGDAPGNTYFNPAILHNGKFVKTKGYCTDVFFAEATRWMGEVKGKKPFFCYISTNAPHTPLQVRPEDEKRYADKVKDANTAKFFGMIANIDDNVGRLLEQLKKWDVERDTLVVFMNDNGGTVGVKVFNAGMRGSKVTPWLGGTRAASLWRWPGTLRPGDVDRLTGHIDFFPTIAALAGAKLTETVKTQVEGRSLVPLLMDATADWPDRLLFTHVGRWPKGARPDDYKFANCAVRSPRWHLVREGKKGWQLFDVKADPGEKADVSAKHPAVRKQLETAYDRWWASVRPGMVNEDAVGPKVNPFKEQYWKQFGKGE